MARARPGRGIKGNSPIKFSRLQPPEQILEALRSGTVDSVMVEGPHGGEVLSLKGADQAYRVMVEAMNEGAVTLSRKGTILYCNPRFSRLVQMPVEKVLGMQFEHLVSREDRARFLRTFRPGERRSQVMMVTLRNALGHPIFTQISSRFLPLRQGLCLVVSDLTQTRRAERALHEFPKRLLQAQENERKRVARELHDGVNQVLSSALFRLQNIESGVRRIDERLGREAGVTRALLEKAIKEVRFISRNLRPSELDDLGLLPAMRTVCEDLAVRTGIAVKFQAHRAWPQFPSEVEVTLYRILQEALSNVEKHSKASRVEIQLRHVHRLIRLRVRDDGQGFQPGNGAGRNPKRSGWGLTNMRERAAFVGGEFQVLTGASRGTEILVTVPSQPLMLPGDSSA